MKLYVSHSAWAMTGDRELVVRWFIVEPQTGAPEFLEAQVQSLRAAGRIVVELDVDEPERPPTLHEALAAYFASEKK